MVNKPLLRPAICHGGTLHGGRLTGHDDINATYHSYCIPGPSKGVKFQPPGLFLTVKGLKFQTLGRFRYLY